MHYKHLEHYHNQRSTVSNLLVLVTATILAFITFDKALDPSDLLLTFLLVVIGGFGIAFCRKYFERTSKHYGLYEAYYEKLDEEFPNLTLKEIQRKVDNAHSKKFPWLRPADGHARLRISSLWIYFHIFILVFGLVLSIVAYFSRIKIEDSASPPAISNPNVGPRQKR